MGLNDKPADKLTNTAGQLAPTHEPSSTQAVRAKKKVFVAFFITAQNKRLMDCRGLCRVCTNNPDLSNRPNWWQKHVLLNVHVLPQGSSLILRVP